MKIPTTRRCLEALAIDTNVVLDYLDPEFTQTGKRSRDLFKAMLEERVVWTANKWLDSECRNVLEKKHCKFPEDAADVIQDLREKMLEEGLLHYPENMANQDLRERLEVYEGEREHDIHIIETALGSPDGACCSDDDDAGKRLCGLADRFPKGLPELARIVWLDFRSPVLTPDDLVRGKCSDKVVSSYRLSRSHPLYERGLHLKERTGSPVIH